MALDAGIAALQLLYRLAKLIKETRDNVLFVKDKLDGTESISKLIELNLQKVDLSLCPEDIIHGIMARFTAAKRTARKLRLKYEPLLELITSLGGNAIMVKAQAAIMRKGVLGSTMAIGSVSVMLWRRVQRTNTKLEISLFEALRDCNLPVAEYEGLPIDKVIKKLRDQDKSSRKFQILALFLIDQILLSTGTRSYISRNLKNIVVDRSSHLKSIVYDKSSQIKSIVAGKSGLLVSLMKEIQEKSLQFKLLAGDKEVPLRFLVQRMSQRKEKLRALFQGKQDKLSELLEEKSNKIQNITAEKSVTRKSFCLENESPEVLQDLLQQVQGDASGKLKEVLGGEEQELLNSTLVEMKQDEEELKVLMGHRSQQVIQLIEAMDDKAELVHNFIMEQPEEVLQQIIEQPTEDGESQMDEQKSDTLDDKDEKSLINETCLALVTDTLNEGSNNLSQGTLTPFNISEGISSSMEKLSKGSITSTRRTTENMKKCSKDNLTSPLSSLSSNGQIPAGSVVSESKQQPKENHKSEGNEEVESNGGKESFQSKGEKRYFSSKLHDRSDQIKALLLSRLVGEAGVILSDLVFKSGERPLTHLEILEAKGYHLSNFEMEYKANEWLKTMLESMDDLNQELKALNSDMKTFDQDDDEIHAADELVPKVTNNNRKNRKKFISDGVDLLMNHWFGPPPSAAKKEPNLINSAIAAQATLEEDKLLNLVKEKLHDQVKDKDMKENEGSRGGFEPFEDERREMMERRNKDDDHGKIEDGFGLDSEWDRSGSAVGEVEENEELQQRLLDHHHAANRQKSQTKIGKKNKKVDIDVGRVLKKDQLKKLFGSCYTRQNLNLLWRFLKRTEERVNLGYSFPKLGEESKSKNEEPLIIYWKTKLEAATGSFKRMLRLHTGESTSEPANGSVGANSGQSKESHSNKATPTAWNNSFLSPSIHSDEPTSLCELKEAAVHDATPVETKDQEGEENKIISENANPELRHPPNIDIVERLGFTSLSSKSEGEGGSFSHNPSFKGFGFHGPLLARSSVIDDDEDDETVPLSIFRQFLHECTKQNLGLGLSAVVLSLMHLIDHPELPLFIREPFEIVKTLLNPLVNYTGSFSLLVALEEVREYVEEDPDEILALEVEADEEAMERRLELVRSFATDFQESFESGVAPDPSLMLSIAVEVSTSFVGLGPTTKRRLALLQSLLGLTSIEEDRKKIERVDADLKAEVSIVQSLPRVEREFSERHEETRQLQSKNLEAERLLHDEQKTATKTHDERKEDITDKYTNAKAFDVRMLLGESGEVGDFWVMNFGKECFEVQDKHFYAALIRSYDVIDEKLWKKVRLLLTDTRGMITAINLQQVTGVNGSLKGIVGRWAKLSKDFREKMRRYHKQREIKMQAKVDAENSTMKLDSSIIDQRRLIISSREVSSAANLDNAAKSTYKFKQTATISQQRPHTTPSSLRVSSGNTPKKVDGLALYERNGKEQQYDKTEEGEDADEEEDYEVHTFETFPQLSNHLSECRKNTPTGISPQQSTTSLPSMRSPILVAKIKQQSQQQQQQSKSQYKFPSPQSNGNDAGGRSSAIWLPRIFQTSAEPSGWNDRCTVESNSSKNSNSAFLKEEHERRFQNRKKAKK